MRKYLGWISLWLGVPLVVVSLPADVPGLTCLAMLYLFVGGACLAVVFFILFFLTRKKPQAAAALLVVVALSMTTGTSRHSGTSDILATK